MEQIEAYAAYGTKIEKFLSYENIDTVFHIDTSAVTLEKFQTHKESITGSTYSHTVLGTASCICVNSYSLYLFSYFSTFHIIGGVSDFGNLSFTAVTGLVLTSGLQGYIWYYTS